MGLLEDEHSVQLLYGVGVDTFGLVDCSDLVFRDSPVIDFRTLLDLMLNLRGRNPAKVQDFVDMRKYLVFEFEMLRQCFRTLEEVFVPLASNAAHTSQFSHGPQSSHRQSGTAKLVHCGTQGRLIDS